MVIVWKVIHSQTRLDPRVYFFITRSYSTARTMAKMLAVMVLSQHRVSLFRNVRPRPPCGVQCMGTLLEHDLRFVQGVRTGNREKFRTPGVPLLHERTKHPYTTFQAIELNLNCLGKAYSNRPGAGHGNEITKPDALSQYFVLYL